MKRRRTRSAEGRDVLSQVVTVALALVFTAYCLLIVFHLRPQPGTPRWRLRASHAPEAVLSAPYVEKPTGAVPVNTADVQTLATIPGVGQVLAEAIVAERLENGLFYYPEDLLCVRGIGEKTLQKLLPYLNLD